jgi:phage RecT family recombinase
MDSVVMGVARIASWHLELGVTAHLIPFGGKAVPVADYKGLCELMIATKAVRYIEAREVREGDVFEYAFGLEPVLRHQPIARSKAAITHVYCVLHLPFGRKAFEVMLAEEVEEIRKKHSKQWKEGPLPAWYAKKTIIRRTAKTLPKNPELAQFFSVLETDEINLDEEIDDATGHVKPAALAADPGVTTPAPALGTGPVKEVPAPSGTRAPVEREPGSDDREF